MKFLYHILLIVSSISISCLKIDAQNTDENAYIINQYFQQNKTENTIVKETDLLNQQNIYNNTIYNSEVAILQTGNYNSVNVKATTNKFDVSQIGNSNNFEFITYFNANKINFEAQQIGNNNQLQVFGQNSIIDNMKIVQFSNNKTVTITNF